MANDFINTERELRRITNISQPVINVENNSPRDIPEGDLRFTHLGKNLILNKKHKGLLWKSNFSADGNQYVDKSLIAEELKFTRKFTDYKFFKHNFYDDIGTYEHYIPWGETTEGAVASTSVDRFTGYLMPYDMTLHKIVFRLKIQSGSIDANANIVVKLGKIDSGDSTEDSVATATYDPASLAALTPFTVNRTDFNASTKIEAGDLAFITVDASADIAGGVEWWITSVWETEIIL